MFKSFTVILFTNYKLNLGFNEASMSALHLANNRNTNTKHYQLEFETMLKKESWNVDFNIISHSSHSWCKQAVVTKTLLTFFCV